MKIRHDALAASGVLITVALLALTPAMFENACTTHQITFRDISVYPEVGVEQDQVAIPNYYAPIGITSLAIIAIGLIVTWAGYIKGVRWTWFVMFVIVWLWAFAVFILPLVYPWRSTVSIAQTFAPSKCIRLLESAMHESGMARDFVEVLLIFLLMVLALVLPIKTFILGRAGGHASNADVVSKRS